MSSSKGGQKSKNYYGTIAGAICWGPLDWLKAVIHNGGYLWQGDLTLTADVTDLTGSIADPSLIAAGGYLKIYRGTDTQPADAGLDGHPPYKGTALLVARNIFFGQDSGTAPNLQIIGGRIPRVPTSIVAAVDNVADDGQVNPIAALAEILLDERGGGLPQSAFDASWLAAAHWAYLNRDFAFCSPLITQQANMRDVVKQLLDPIDGFLRWSKTGQLSCNIYEWGVDPGGLPVIDARAWTRKPEFVLGDWIDIPTEYLVSFTDRAFEFQENSVLVPDARARQIRQLDDQKRLARPDITRASQAHRHAVEVKRRLGTAPSTSTIRVRGPIVESLEPGDKIRVDTDPEPGGAGLSQMCRVNQIERSRSDEATIKVTTDNLLPASVYSPDYPTPTPVDEVCPPLVNFIGVPLPPNAWGWPPSVGLIAERPSATVVGFEAYFGTSHAGSFADLGQQGGFAVRASLAADITNSATSANFTESSGLNAPDAGLAANTPGGNTTEAGGNVLLALLATLDVDGRIALDADGDPILEFVSIVDRAFVSGATHSYTILRGRMGTTARAWTAAGTVVWIVPRGNIVPWTHPLLSSMVGGVAYFRLVAFTPRATDESTPVPECSVNMLPATAPMYVGNTDGTTGPDDGVAPNPVSGVTVTAGLQQLILEWSNPTNTPLRRIFIYESTTTTRPSSPQFAISEKQTAFFRTGLPSSALRYYWIEVQALNGRRTIAGYFSGTTRAGINLADIVPGLTMVEIVNTLPTSGNFDGRTVFLTTDKKLYRYDATAGAFKKSVETVDLTGQIDGTQITDGAISTPKLAANAITAAKIAANAITAEKIAADAVTAGVIAAGAITAAAIGANEIIAYTANLADAVITGAKIADATIGSAKIIDAAIVRAKIADLAVDTAKIDDLAVETLKIADFAVTVPLSAAASGPTAVAPNAQVDLLYCSGMVVEGSEQVLMAASFEVTPVDNDTFDFRFYRNGSLVYSTTEKLPIIAKQTRAIIWAESPGAGTHDYKLTIYAASGNTGSANFRNMAMFTLSTKK